MVVRNYQFAGSQVTFSLNAPRQVLVNTREFEGGELNLQVDGKPAGKVRVQQGGASFQLTAGEHSVAMAR